MRPDAVVIDAPCFDRSLRISEADKPVLVQTLITVGGLRIWYFLRSRLGCPLMIVRTTADWVASESPHGGQPLSSVERHALVRMRQELGSSEGPDLDMARALIDSLLTHGVKVEQERY